AARPCPPGAAKRCPPGRSAEEVQGSVAETGGRRGPLPTSRPAWARRNTRASRVCVTHVSHVGRASSGKGRVRGRIAGLQEKTTTKMPLAPGSLLAEQCLFDSNCPGAARPPACTHALVVYIAGSRCLAARSTTRRSL